MDLHDRFRLCVFVLLSLTFRADGGQSETLLRLDAVLLTPEVVERTPIVASLRIRNISTEITRTIFSTQQPQLIAQRATLILIDIEGDIYRLSYRGGALPEETAPVAVHPLAPGAVIEVERIVSLIFETPVPPRWAGRLSERYSFLRPGSYRGSFEVAMQRGKRLVSDEFALTVLEAQQGSIEARNIIKFRHVGFFEGRDRPIDETDFSGRKSHGKLDVSRFGELQAILDDAPDSAYAHWIMFWKLYHHGSVNDAVEWSRGHREFPLADNLMLHKAEGLFNSAGKHDGRTYNRVRALVDELTRDFPDGDTRFRAAELQKKLTRKP